MCMSLGQWHSHDESTTDNRTVLMVRKEVTERKCICAGEEATIRVAITKQVSAMNKVSNTVQSAETKGQCYSGSLQRGAGGCRCWW